jgi:hypothetical protein
MAAAAAILGLALLALPVRAQMPQADARLSAVIVDSFPQVTLYASIRDDQGRRLADLPPGAFQILEDDVEVPVESAAEEEAGARLVFVLHTARPMELRDPLGRRRYDAIREELQAWWRQPGAARVGQDDLSLWTDDGPVVSHSDSAAELSSVLAALEPAFTEGQDGLEVLLSALASTSGPTPRPGMVNQIVFITPFETTISATSLESIQARALASRTAIYPILIAPADAAGLAPALALQQLAKLTGGAYLRFEPGTSLIDLAEQILDQRVQVRLVYQSPVNVPGTHSVRLRVVHEGLDFTSNPAEYIIDVRSPQVTFVDPPLRITRTSEDPADTVQTLPPTRQDLRLLIEFPDGHPRELVESQLLVDGVVVARQTSTPLDVLTWDLSAYERDESHRVQAVVVDRLGLQGTTEPVTIQVDVDAPSASLISLRTGWPTMLAAAAVLLIGGIVAATVAARARPQVPTEAPVVSRRRVVVARAGMGAPGAGAPAEAYLIPEDAGEESIPLRGGDVVFGRDPSLAAVRLDDPSISPIHARLIRQADGSYLLRDQGSTAGTWLNADEVPEEGRRVRHGDCIYLGRVGFRFRMAAEPPAPDVRLTPAESPILPPRPPERRT